MLAPYYPRRIINVVVNFINYYWRNISTSATKKKQIIINNDAAALGSIA